MSQEDLASIIEPLRAEAETRIKHELSGPLNVGKRFLYDSIMPLYLNVTAGSHEVCLKFMVGGEIELQQNSAPNPDVVVKGDLEAVRKVMILRSARTFDEEQRSGRISVTSNSWKGQQALEKVREILGSNP